MYIEWRDAFDFVRDVRKGLTADEEVEFRYCSVLGDLSRALCEYRMGFKMTDKQLADQIGVSVETLQKYENGGQELTLRELVRVCYYLGRKVELNDD